VSIVTLKPGYEEVFTVMDYYDGPRRGIANFNGKPHFYDCVLDESRQNYSDRYRLNAIPNHIFELAMEDCAIWEKWQAAFLAGKTSKGSHPALPQDRSRHEVIRSILDAALRTDELTCVIRIGSFEALAPPKLSRGTMIDTQVRWTEENP